MDDRQIIASPRAGKGQDRGNPPSFFVRHSGPVLASNSRPRIAQRFLPSPVLAPILRERDALRFLPSPVLALILRERDALRFLPSLAGARTKDGGDGAGIHVIDVSGLRLAPQ